VAITLFLNRKSGTVTEETESQLRELLGQDVALKGVSSKTLANEIREAVANNRAIVAGGGDGTISSVAQHLVGTETPLGILPLGTLNHLAKDLKLPLELNKAVDAVLHGKRDVIDTACVNDRPFLNNSALGLYPRLVVYRENLEKKGTPRWVAVCRAAWFILTRYRTMSIEFEIEGKRVQRSTPLVFVGNDRYTLEGFRVGSRESLKDGLLTVVIARHAKPLSFFFGALSMLIGRHRRSTALEVLYLPSLTVRTRTRKTIVAVDGEVVTMTPPLHYTIRPHSLTVLVPHA
jgi:diacylglycerol kinase family enzyme